MAIKRGVGGLLVVVTGCAAAAPAVRPTPRVVTQDPALSQLQGLAADAATLEAAPQARRARIGGRPVDRCYYAVVAVLGERADAVRIATIEPALVVAAWVPRDELATVVTTVTPLYAAIDDAAASVTLRPGAPVEVDGPDGPRGHVVLTTLGESAAGFVERAALGQVYTPLLAPPLDGPRVQAFGAWAQAAPVAASPALFTTFAGVYVERGRAAGYVEVEHAGAFVAGRGFIAETALRPTPAIGACEGSGERMERDFGAVHGPGRWAGAVTLPVGVCLRDAATGELAAVARSSVAIDISVLDGEAVGQGTIDTVDGPRAVQVPVIGDAQAGYELATDTCGSGAS